MLSIGQKAMAKPRDNDSDLTHETEARELLEEIGVGSGIR